MKNKYLKLPKGQPGRILNRIAKLAFQNLGYSARRLPGRGKANVWEVTRGGETHLMSVRTSRDRSFAFPRLKNGWKTLDDVDLVMVVSVDDRYEPKNAEVYVFPADEVHERFNAALKARLEYGQTVRFDYGMWVRLDTDKRGIARSVGSGIADKFPREAVYSLADFDAPDDGEEAPDELLEGGGIEGSQAPGTIAEVISSATQQIAALAGVEPERVKLELKIEG